MISDFFFKQHAKMDLIITCTFPREVNGWDYFTMGKLGVTYLKGGQRKF